MSDVRVEARADHEGAGPHGDGVAAEPAAPHLGWAVAGLCSGAAVIHFAMVPAHGGSGLTDPLAFAAAGWFQLLVAGAILAERAGKRVYQAAALGNLAIVGLWAWSRTAGMPFGAHRGLVEDVALLDGVCAALEVGAILLAVRLLLAPGRRSIGRLTPTLAAVGALGLATLVITSPDAASHGDGGAAAPAVSPHDALMADLDARRCDTAFNPPAYWKEAKQVGIDTYQGGAMSPDDHSGAPAAAAPSGDGHGHSHGASAAPMAGPTTTTTPDPTQGRGSVGLDKLITRTSLAGGGEVASAMLVSALGNATQDDYDAWLWWLESSGSLSHDHAAGAGDGGAHGAHVGPQPWVAMTDQAQCDRLADELALARKTALKYPTAADVVKAGYRQVAPYIAGIAGHYMKYSLVDDTFEIDQPEMILYDGNGPDAHVVGLSYYLLHEGDAEPVQGFTGANDHFHRHIGLCSAPGGGVIGDSSLTDEQCAEIGGVKSKGDRGWMSHAWVVPGCESPWGVFSGASPTNDDGLGLSSGEDDGHCAGSGVRERYGLDDAGSVDSLSRTADTSGN